MKPILSFKASYQNNISFFYHRRLEEHVNVKPEYQHSEKKKIVSPLNSSVFIVYKDLKSI